MSLTKIHFFAGAFGSLEAAERYCNLDWGEAPSEDASAPEWEAWEAEYPTWALQQELDAHLDEDFIELHFGAARDASWPELVLEERDREQIRSSIEPSDTLVLLDANALGGFEARLRSTSRLRYLGAFAARW